MTGAKTVIWKDWVLMLFSAAGPFEVTNYFVFFKELQERNLKAGNTQT